MKVHSIPVSYRTIGRRPLASFLIAALLSASSIQAQQRTATADWPCYAGNPARTATTTEAVEFPLAVTWVYEPAQAPAPAWPEPHKERHRMDFDWAPQPVVADGLVVFGSSSDDTVRALDVADGAFKWRFTTGGPIRFAPAIYEGKVYVASDDGILYCLAVQTGKLIWKFRGGPQDRRMIGNHRMISRWPMRTGVLVDQGTAYVTAGMWSSEGVFVYALDAGTGKVRWCNDTSGIDTVTHEKMGAQVGGVPPQGYLAASSDLLLVPTGRTMPAVYDRKTGRLVYRRWLTGGARLMVLEEKGVFLGTTRTEGELAYSLDTGVEIGIWKAPDEKHYPPYWHYRDSIRARDGAIDVSGKVFSLISSKNHLLAGGENFVAAYDTTDKKWIWTKKNIDGQVRGLALAGDRLFAATHTGRLYCLQKGPKRAGGPRVVRDGAGKSEVASRPDRLETAVLRALKQTGTTRGYALIVGSQDARLPETLARETKLHVIAGLAAASTVAGERARLLSSTNIYGSRIVVHDLSNAKVLPYAPYFANAVIVAGPVGEQDAKEAYRVVRPCGGRLLLPGMKEGDARKLLKSAGIPDTEVSIREGMVAVTRGKLAGAFDWDSDVTCDHRVKWPLEMLWFGGPNPVGPGPAQMAYTPRWTKRTPIGANGRYFVVDRHHVLAVDAYNGSILWSRDVPNAGVWLERTTSGIKPFKTVRRLSADDRHVYLALGQKGDVCYKLNAQTGEVEDIYGTFREPERFSLERPQTFELAPAGGHSGTVKLSKTRGAVQLVLRTKEPESVARAIWELHFDLRPVAQRVNLYGPGIFRITVDSRTGEWRQESGAGCPKVTTAREQFEGGSEITVQVPVGTVKDFGFAVALSYFQDIGYAESLKSRTRRFTECVAYNDGWAVFGLNGVPAATRRMPDEIKSLDDLPAVALRWGRSPRRVRLPEDKTIITGTDSRGRPRKSVGPFAYLGSPMTEQDRGAVYQKSHGCGATTVPSATLDFLRSSSLAIYNYEDDSGLRTIGEVRPGCGSSGILPAFGVVVESESSAHCTCQYSYNTSLALVPASKQRHEDWSIFYDKAGGALNRATLNLGAPGDRRDDGGALWLGMPRPSPIYSLHVPLAVDRDARLGSFRFNADRVTIKNTKRPWIYASGFYGVRRMVLDLDMLTQPIVSVGCAQPPKTDANLNDPCWQSATPVPMTPKGESLFLRHDKDNLYIAFRREVRIGRRGPVLWERGIAGVDTAVWDDAYTSYGLYLGDKDFLHGVHLAFSAVGGWYDASWVWDGKVRDAKESKAWNGELTKAIHSDGNGFVAEIAVPWQTLKKAGMKIEPGLVIGSIRERRGPLRHIGTDWERRDFKLLELVDRVASKEERAYSVRLHFCEPDDVQPGQRVFDVRLQGKMVLRNFDIVKEAGGRHIALVKEFDGITAGQSINLEMISKTKGRVATSLTAPVLCGFEVNRSENP
jgi:outer membrane protein assembly factor BamB